MHKFSFFFLIMFLFGCTANTKRTGNINIVVNSEDRVLSGIEHWQGTDDCSFSATINKEELGIRIFIDVKDDELISESDKVHNKDGVEIYFDTRPYRLKQKNRYMKGVFQAIIFPCFSKVHANSASFYPSYYHSEIPGTKVVSKINTRSDGYRITVFFPFSGFEQNHYAINNEFSFDIAVNDADSDGRSQLIWAGNVNNWKEPLNFKTIILE